MPGKNTAPFFYISNTKIQIIDLFFYFMYSREEVARATNSRPSCDEAPRGSQKPPNASDTRARGDNNDNNDTTDNRDRTLASQESHRRESGDSDSSGTERVSEGRTRRIRKPVTYKEKPLNR